MRFSCFLRIFAPLNDKGDKAMIKWKNNIELFAVLALIVSAIPFASCSNDRTPVPQPVTRLDRVMARYGSMDSMTRVNVLDSLRPEIVALMQVLEVDTVTDETVMAWALSYPVAVFSPLADSAFQNLDTFEAELGGILQRAEDAGLKLPQRRYVAVTWGRSESIVFNDSIALIALNHYLGPDSPSYYGWPEYRRRNKRPDMMGLDMAEALVGTAYPYAPAAGRNNVLSRMLYEGALTEAKLRLTPNADQRRALGFTRQQMADLQTNCELIWKKMVTEKMLYSTDETLMDRLFSALPYSTPISRYAPGRTARYTGHEIVRSYLAKHPDTSLATLLSPDWYCDPATLREAAYTPKAESKQN